MNIELKEITVRELTEGYEDKAESGVIGLVGGLISDRRISGSSSTRISSGMRSSTPS